MNLTVKSVEVYRMALNFGAWRKALPDERLLVSGYCRRLQFVLSNLSNNNPYITIPQLCCSIIVSYYADGEYFAFCRCNFIKTLNQKRTVKKLFNSTWENTCYEKQTINPLKDKGNYKWTVSVKRMRRNAIIALSSKFSVGKHTAAELGVYRFTCYHGCVEINGLKTIQLSTGWKFRKNNNTGHVGIEFNADGDNSYIMFTLGSTNEHHTIPANEIMMNRVYRLAVSLCNKNDRISISNFEYRSK